MAGSRKQGGRVRQPGRELDVVAVAGRSFGCFRASFRHMRFEELRSHQAGGERAVARHGEIQYYGGRGHDIGEIIEWC